MTDHAIRVIKVGGSVLTSPQAYRRVAQYVAARLIKASGERLAVVVSAELGVTDALLQTAREFTSDPDPSTVDLLWSTGELRSVALLALALQALGVRATTANVHQLGLSHDFAFGRRSLSRRLSSSPAFWHAGMAMPSSRWVEAGQTSQPCF
jgi:aspartate kinase